MPLGFSDRIEYIAFVSAHLPTSWDSVVLFSTACTSLASDLVDIDMRYGSGSVSRLIGIDANEEITWTMDSGPYGFSGFGNASNAAFDCRSDAMATLLESLDLCRVCTFKANESKY